MLYSSQMFLWGNLLQINSLWWQPFRGLKFHIHSLKESSRMAVRALFYVVSLIVDQEGHMFEDEDRFKESYLTWLAP